MCNSLTKETTGLRDCRVVRRGVGRPRAVGEVSGEVGDGVDSRVQTVFAKKLRIEIEIFEESSVILFSHGL